MYALPSKWARPESRPGGKVLHLPYDRGRQKVKKALHAWLAMNQKSPCQREERFYVRGKNVCVRKLAVNSGDCAIPKSAALLFLSVTEVVRLASRENMFLLKSWEFGKQNFKLQECAVIAINFVYARS